MNVFSVIKRAWDSNKKNIFAGAVAIGTGIAAFAGAVLAGRLQSKEECASYADRDELTDQNLIESEETEKTEETGDDAE